MADPCRIQVGTGLSCGATTVSGVSYGVQDPCEMVKTILACRTRYTFFVMADARMAGSEGSNMERFRAYTKEHKLGPVIATIGWHLNEAHGPNKIKVYVWRPDYNGAGMKEWREKNPAVDLAKAMW